jgi:hypothetical protein
VKFTQQKGILSNVVFGNSLESIPQINDVPNFIHNAVSYLQSKAASQPELFLASVDDSELKALKISVEAGIHILSS